MRKLAIRIPVLAVTVLGGSLILADELLVAALIVSFFTLSIIAVAPRVFHSTRSSARPRLPISMESEARAVAYTATHRS